MHLRSTNRREEQTPIGAATVRESVPLNDRKKAPLPHGRGSDWVFFNGAVPLITRPHDRGLMNGAAAAIVGQAVQPGCPVCAPTVSRCSRASPGRISPARRYESPSLSPPFSARFSLRAL